MKQRTPWLAMAIVAATGAMGIAAHAQPDPNNPAMGNNVPNGPQPPTPEQRQQLRDVDTDSTTRRELIMAGFTDRKIQDAVVAYAIDQDKAMGKLRDSGRKLIQAIRDKVPDAQISMLLNDLRADTDAERDRRHKAAADLDAKISFSKNARLEAYLTMIGVLGDEASLINSNIGGGNNGGGGFGGMGGGFGFGGGGFGGFGGFGGMGGGGFGGRGGRGGRGGGAAGGANGAGGAGAARPNGAA